MSSTDYINGYIERNGRGEYTGELKVDGVNLSPITAQYFKQDGENYLWLKRRPLLEYDMYTQKYNQREREPRFEVYMKKQVDDGAFAYIGQFTFLRFCFKIIGLWDMNSRDRLNLFVERLPMEQQAIINGINKRKRGEK